METIKTFSSKANANRAAKQAGLTAEQFTVDQQADGRWYFEEVLPAVTEAPVVTENQTWREKFPEMSASLITAYGVDECPHCNIGLDNGVGVDGDEVNGTEVKHEKFQFACLACGEEFGPAVAPVAAKREILNHSTIERPTKRVWHIADDMLAANPEVRRKDVIQACVDAGIAFFTARTQYQEWYKTLKGSQK